MLKNCTLLICLNMFALTCPARGDVEIRAEVLSSTATSHTVRFKIGAENSFGGFTAPSQPWSEPFLFIDYSSSQKLKAALDAPLDTSGFNSNSVASNTGGKIHTIEVREDTIFDRIGLVFDQSFTAASTLTTGKEITVTFPTSGAISTADFERLSIYWGLGHNGTNFIRGSLIGETVAETAVTELLEMQIEVIDSDASTHTVRFRIEDKNSLAGALATTPEFLDNFLFIDISSSPKLVAAIDAPWDYVWDEPWTLVKVETRKADLFPRIGFEFSQSLTPISTLPSGMEFVVQFETSAPIASSDFAGLPIIWGFDDGGNPFFSGGQLVGSTVPETKLEVSQSSQNIIVSFSGFLQSSSDLGGWSLVSPQPVSPLVIPRSGAPSQLFFRSSRTPGVTE